MFALGRRRRSWWAAIVLPGLVLRALIPVGFMAGHSGLELCWGAGAMPGMEGHHHPHLSDHDRHDGPGHPSHSTEHGAVCVFAASAAGLAPPSVPASIVSVVVTSERLSLTASAERFIPTILRAQSPRGPPRLS